MKVLIGTSGFSYPDWQGQFYPRSLKPAERLGFYARHFPAVEINTSYYGIPSPSTTARWAGQAPPGFRFAVKAHQDMTHGDQFQPEVFQQFREAIAPLREAGMLGPVLAQFPWKFRRTPENERYLATVRQELAELPVVIEFRNAAWAADETFELLRDLELGYCCVDEPRFKNLMPPVITATAPVGYVRFHGRNYEKWWSGSSIERYDYRYSLDELVEWVPKVTQLAEATEQTYVFFNNHFESKAGVNAKLLADLLERMAPGVEVEPAAEGGGTGLPLAA